MERGEHMVVSGRNMRPHLLLCTFFVEGETGVNLSRDTTRDDLQNFLSKFYELKMELSEVFFGNLAKGLTYQSVYRCLNLLIDASSLLPSGLNSSIDKPCITGLVSRCKDE